MGLAEISRSGSVCLDVINQTWSPMYDMINIFEVFLPQLLRYPNPTDPLNGEAAALLMRDPNTYNLKVKGESQSSRPSMRTSSDTNADYVARFATKESVDEVGEEDGDDDEMSSVGEFDSEDEDPAGDMEV